MVCSLGLRAILRVWDLVLDCVDGHPGLTRCGMAWPDLAWCDIAWHAERLPGGHAAGGERADVPSGGAHV